MGKISFFYEGCKKPSFLVTGRVVTWLKQIISDYCFKTGDISFILSTDSYLLDLNRKFLNHDYYTDVITFDYTENSTLSADIFISLDTVEDNAGKFDVSYDEELHRVMVHGILHLMGFKDKTEIEMSMMREAENKALEWLKNMK